MTIHDRLVEIDPNEEKYKIIKFEDLITDYENTVSDLYNFFGIDEINHTRKKTFLKPKVSIKNVGLWKQILMDREAQAIYGSFKHFYEKYGYQF